MVSVVLMASLIASGLATRYDDGVMARVVANRVAWGQLDLATPHDSFVALLECDQIGNRVWLELPDGSVSGPHLVADCGAQHDRDDLEAKGFAVDLSYALAQELGVMDAPLAGVKVWDVDPRWGLVQ